MTDLIIALITRLVACCLIVAGLAALIFDGEHLAALGWITVAIGLAAKNLADRFLDELGTRGPQ
jgi:hypothetical protein